MIHIGFLVQQERSYVITDMLPDRLKDLVEETLAGIRGSCIGHTKIPPVGKSVQRFNVSRPVLRRLISLMLWAKDKRGLGEYMEFVAGIMTEDLRKEIHKADIRDQFRKSQKKAVEAILADRFTTPLNISFQWQRYNIELQSALGSIVGSKGIVISYVVHENKLPDLAGSHNTW